MKICYKILFLLSLLTVASTAANVSTAELNVTTDTFLRFTDNNEEYGKSCEEYTYIVPLQRLKLITHKNAYFADILSDVINIPIVAQDIIVKPFPYQKQCEIQGIDTSIYTYTENILYLNSEVLTIHVFQYSYGAGAAHGNGHASHYIYGREYGMSIAWEDLFEKDESFDRYVLDRVVKELASEEFITDFKSGDQLFNFRKSGYFGINSEGLVIQYGKYEITPGASGLPSLTVPKEVLKKYMHPKMYDKCFTRQKLYVAKGK